MVAFSPLPHLGGVARLNSDTAFLYFLCHGFRDLLFKSTYLVALIYGR
jgi:hypothetical protein